MRNINPELRLGSNRVSFDCAPFLYSPALAAFLKRISKPLMVALNLHGSLVSMAQEVAQEMIELGLTANGLQRKGMCFRETLDV